MSSRTITTTALNNQNKGDDHEKKMVLITGANKGIGKEIARLIGLNTWILCFIGMSECGFGDGNGE